MKQATGHIALVGGTGFIGRAVSKALRSRGCKVRLVARHQPRLLQSAETFMPANISEPESLLLALEGCDVVVNLVAILTERGSSFEEVIHQGARHVAMAARTAGAAHLVHVSALGADAASPSAYARAKFQAECAVREIFPGASMIRPSLVMGNGGGFRQQVEKLTRHVPVMVLPGGGHTRFQPVKLEDLAETIASACTNPQRGGAVVNAAGPQVFTFRQLVEQELATLGRRRLLLPLPWSLTWATAYAMTMADSLTLHRLLPEWMLVTPDQVRLLQTDNTLDALRPDR